MFIRLDEPGNGVLQVINLPYEEFDDLVDRLPGRLRGGLFPPVEFGSADLHELAAADDEGFQFAPFGGGPTLG